MYMTKLETYYFFSAAQLSADDAQSQIMSHPQSHIMSHLHYIHYTCNSWGSGLQKPSSKASDTLDLFFSTP